MPASNLRFARRPLRAARVPVRARPRVVVARIGGFALFASFGPAPAHDSLFSARRISGGVGPWLGSGVASGWCPGLGRMRGLVASGLFAGFALPALRG